MRCSRYSMVPDTKLILRERAAIWRVVSFTRKDNTNLIYLKLCRDQPRVHIFSYDFTFRTHTHKVEYTINTEHGSAMSLVANLSSRRPGFIACSLHVGFVVHKDAVGQVFSRILRFSPVNTIPLLLSAHIHLWTERQVRWWLQLRDIVLLHRHEKPKISIVGSLYRVGTLYESGNELI
jgi:hypothetical protein